MPTATNYLRGAEQSALRGSPSFYTGTGRPVVIQGTGKRKRGLAALIVTLILAVSGGIFLVGSNSLLAPALEALFTEATDTQYTSYNLRNRRLTQYMLKGDYPVTTNWTGVQKYNHLPNKFRRRLAEYGIDVEGTGSNLTLKYHDPSTDEIIDIPADRFADVYQENLDFREAYTNAKRGRVATFFDSVADRIYQKLGLSRNIFNDYRQTGDAEVDSENYRNTMSDQFDGDTTTLSGFRQESDDDGPRYDDDGNPILETDSGDGINSATSGSSSGAEAESQATSFLNGVAGQVSRVADGTCAILAVANMISGAVAANEIYQSINYFMGLMENVSKMKAGEGDESAINEVLNTLTTPAPASITDYQDASLTTTSDGQNTVALSETTTDQAPLEAAGMQLVLADVPVTASQTTNYSLERVGNVLSSVGLFAGTSLATCAAAQGVGAAISILSVVLSGGIFNVIGGFVVDTVISATTSIVIGSILSFAIPTIAQVFFTNMFDQATGVVVGELFTRGASAANTRIGRTGSAQSLSSANATYAYNQSTATILAEDAELDRHTKSPFDTTNQNTFFGSIAYNLLPIAASSQTSSVASLLRTTASSLSSLVGSVSATGAGSSYMTTFGDCPTLEAIGAVGDIYCNPITTTDLSTIDIEPSDTDYVDAIHDSLDCDAEGNCEIRDNTNLAYYAAYCAERDSPFGIADANILNEFSATADAGTLGTVIESLPLIGDVLSIYDSQDVINNMGWINGSNCVNNSETNPQWDEEYKYYQRYIEDQRILEQMGAYEDSTNPVTAYVEKREAELPYLTDNTPAGYLARISGITKSDAETLLALAEYYTFLADYDASVRLIMADSTTATTDGATVSAQISTERYRYTNPSPITPTDTPIIATHILYADLRGRTTIA